MPFMFTDEGRLSLPDVFTNEPLTLVPVRMVVVHRAIVARHSKLGKKDNTMSQAMDAVMGTLDNLAEGNGTMNTETIVLDSGDSKKDPAFIHMPLTPELLAACRQAAGENVALGPWLQQYMAERLNVTLPVKTDGRQRYTTEEARQAAKVASREKAANLRKGLLMAHRARQANDAAALEVANKLIADNS